VPEVVVPEQDAPEGPVPDISYEVETRSRPVGKTLLPGARTEAAFTARAFAEARPVIVTRKPL
jgi:hypothetical protein